VPRAETVPRPRGWLAAGSASCGQGSAGAGDSGGDAQSERVKSVARLNNDNLFWDTSRRTFADVYFSKDSNARALVRYKNTLCMVRAVFTGFPLSVQESLAVRVMLCLSAKRPPSPKAAIVELFGVFVVACTLGGVTRVELEGAAEVAKKTRGDCIAKG